MPDSSRKPCPVIIVMGVAGSGKTTLARALAEQLGHVFIEGDEFHGAANVAKMAAGLPLENSDRRGWIAALTDAVRTLGAPCVVSCSALNPEVRNWIDGALDVAPDYVLLHGGSALLHERLSARSGHFFDPALLGSQLAALDPPPDAVRIDIALPTEEQVHIALKALARRA